MKVTGPPVSLCQASHIEQGICSVYATGVVVINTRGTALGEIDRPGEITVSSCSPCSAASRAQNPHVVLRMDLTDADG